MQAGIQYDNSTGMRPFYCKQTRVIVHKWWGDSIEYFHNPSP